MDPDWWIELEKTYFERMRERRDIYRRHGHLVLQYLPGSELACKELMEMSVQFLCARYPMYFSMSEDHTVLRNRLLGTETDLEVVNPLHVLFENIPEDFTVMIREPKDGFYYFRAGRSHSESRLRTVAHRPQA